jgi:hypothetical protein
MRVCRNVVRRRHRIAGDAARAGPRHLLDRGAVGPDRPGQRLHGPGELGEELRLVEPLVALSV